MMVIHGDCLEQMATLPAESVDSIVTDPPYGLSFMGKDWDHGVPGEAFWREALRVAKPGAHLLAFGGTRTYHRLACAIEDAGWEIRDCIMWVYGSGFPKSHDVSKAIDKANGRKFEDRYELGRHIRERREAMGLSRAEVNKAFDSVAICNHWEAQDRNNALPPTLEHWERLKTWLGCDSKYDALVDRMEAKREVVGQHAEGSTPGGFGEHRFSFNSRDITAPATDAAKQWQGWGTALKPAYEPIIVARKPLIGTVAANVQQYGTGAINVDGCRVGEETRLNRSSGIPGAGRMRACNRVDRGDGKTLDGRNLANLITYAERSKDRAPQEVSGRWPANFIHDGSDEVVGLFPVTGPSLSNPTVNFVSGSVLRKRSGGYDEPAGSAARFFYTAKASKRDRDEGCEGLKERGKVFNGQSAHSAGLAPGSVEDKFTTAPARNFHPTVKPTDLMRYLCRLVTPPGGVVLDPFMGSGSTGKGAILEGFNFIGIEQNAEYIEIAKARIAFARTQVEQEPAKVGNLQTSLFNADE